MFSAHLCSVFPVSPFNEHAALAVQDAFIAHMKTSGKQQSMLRMSELHLLRSSVDFKAHSIWRKDRWATNTGRLLQRVRALGQLPARILCVTNVIAGCNATSRESTDAAVGVQMCPKTVIAVGAPVYVKQLARAPGVLHTSLPTAVKISRAYPPFHMNHLRAQVIQRTI